MQRTTLPFGGTAFMEKVFNEEVTPRRGSTIITLEINFQV
jgi:hypothetical protein